MRLLLASILQAARRRSNIILPRLFRAIRKRYTLLEHSAFLPNLSDGPLTRNRDNARARLFRAQSPPPATMGQPDLTYEVGNAFFLRLRVSV